MRLDFYVGERDLFGLGFSDNVVFRKQYYVRAVFGDIADLSTLQAIELHNKEQFTHPDPSMRRVAPDKWEFEVGGTGFKATMRLSFPKFPRTASLTSRSERRARQRHRSQRTGPERPPAWKRPWKRPWKRLCGRRSMGPRKGSKNGTLGQGARADINPWRWRS